MCEGKGREGLDDESPPSPYKTTMVIWSRFSGEEVELEDLAREATSGQAYYSRPPAGSTRAGSPSIWRRPSLRRW
jgi:hypothetical protein